MATASGPITIQRVETKKDIGKFIAFQWKVYKDDPNWVPPLYFERLEFLDREKNAFFGHAEVDYFIARRGGEIVGTIAAFINRRHNEFHNEKTGWFGFFEVLPDYEVAEKLLQTAADWVRQRGMTVLRGPAQFSTNEECALLVEGFDTPPMILMTYNPPYYKEYIERAGFHKAMDILEYYLETAAFGNQADGISPKLARVVRKLRDHGGLTTRIVRIKQLDDEIAWVKGVYNTAWEKNWGFVPMDDREFDAMAKQLKSILDPEIVQIVEKDGKPVGFGLTLPDMSEPLRKIHPGPSVLSSYLAAARLILFKRRPKGLRVFALGVLPDFRGQGVDALLYYQTVAAAIKFGYTHGEMGWVLENNMMMNRAIVGLGGQVKKVYRFYDKEL